MRRKERFVKITNRHCPFCEGKTVPDYKDAATLEKYLTERGKIVSRSRSGVCSKHQRLLSRAIKQARHLALVPFVVRA